MLGPAPEDFWQRVVIELARTIWQRETGRTVVAIGTAMQSAPVTSYAHAAHKVWQAPAVPPDDTAS